MKLSSLVLGDLVLASGNRKLALTCILKEKGLTKRVDALIEMGAWVEAIEESVSGYKNRFTKVESERLLKQIKDKGPDWVLDIISNEINAYKSK